MKLKKNEFLLTTDANTLRSYLTHGAIYSNEVIESDNIGSSASNIEDKFLFISKKSLIISEQKNSTNTGNSFPIILHLVFDDAILSSTQTYHFNQKYFQSTKTLSKSLNTPSHSLFNMVVGGFSIQFVKRIYFKNLEDINRFTFKIDNLYYPEDLFEINEDVFNDNFELKFSSIYSKMKFNLEETVNIDNSVKIMKIRHKLKGALIGALTGYSKLIDKYEVKFCGNDLNLINPNKQDHVEIINVILKNINDLTFDEKSHLHESLIHQDFAPIFNNINELFEQYFISRMYGTEIIPTTFLNSENPQLVVFFYMMRELIEHPYLSNFNPSKFLLSILNTLENDIILSTNDKLLYKEILNFIKNQILTDQNSILESLSKENKPELSLSRAIMIFLKTPYFHMHDQLEANIKSFAILPEDKRLIWILFGLLNGFVAFPSNKKRDPFLNRYIDIVVDSCCTNSFLINGSNGIELFESYTKRNKKLWYFNNSLPLLLYNKKSESERFANILHLNMIKSLKSENSSKDIRKMITSRIFDKIDLFEEVIDYICTIKKNDTNKFTENANSYFINIVSPKSVQIKRDISGYLMKIVNDYSFFLKEFKRNEKFWKNIYFEIESLKTDHFNE